VTEIESRLQETKLIISEGEWESAALEEIKFLHLLVEEYRQKMEVALDCLRYAGSEPKIAAKAALNSALSFNPGELKVVGKTNDVQTGV